MPPMNKPNIAIASIIFDDPAAPGAQKLDAAVRAWAAIRARRGSGEISEEEYVDWKRGFTGR